MRMSMCLKSGRSPIRCPSDGELAVRLAKMTPMLANVDVDSLDLSGMKQITD